MNPTLSSFISAKKINTFQKLRLLLLLHKNPHLDGTCQDFARQLHLGHSFYLEDICVELEEVDLVVQVKDRYKLSDNPDIRQHLQDLAKAFDNPLTRQDILRQIGVETNR